MKVGVNIKKKEKRKRQENTSKQRDNGGSVKMQCVSVFMETTGETASFDL